MDKMIKVRGDWMEAGFHCDLAPREALLGIDGDGFYDFATGDRITMDLDGELRGWPCFTFMPETKECDRLRSLKTPELNF